MKYNLKEFYQEVESYKNIIKKHKEKEFLILLNTKDKNAFFSIAPLSRAFHDLKKDINITISDKKEALKNINQIWDTYSDLKKRKSNKKTKLLREFISFVKKKIKDKKTKDYFESIFEKPVILKANKKGFESKNLFLPYKSKWFKAYRTNDLNKTCRRILTQCYNIKKNERISLGFELIPTKKDLGLPLKDYFDSYAISWAMLNQARKVTKNVAMGTSTSRFKLLDFGEKISELKATIIGCELSKDIDLKVFKIYKKLSKALDIKIKFSGMTFFIHGKGNSGRHIFGEFIGYPSPDKKTKWKSPGGIIYKLDWAPQSRIDKRNPIARVGFTETLPIDVFISSCYVNYKDIWKRNNAIKQVGEKCEYVIVEGKQTNFKVYLKKKNGKMRWFRASDSDVRYKVNPEMLKKEKIKTGMFANFPGGEAFVTPEYVEGRITGDVIISVDQSYRINPNKPIIIEVDKKGYKILSGEKKILDKIKEKKKEAWSVIKQDEKNKSLPKEIIELKKKNFNNIGEFAINTNPKAKLCNYLIVNEKIARMIHVALGSGFEPDKISAYHYDIVINAAKQKLNIYGMTKDNKELWIMKKGKLVV